MENEIEESAVYIQKIKKAIDRHTNKDTVYLCMLESEDGEGSTLLGQGSIQDFANLIGQMMLRNESVRKAVETAYIAVSIYNVAKAKED